MRRRRRSEICGSVEEEEEEEGEEERRGREREGGGKDRWRRQGTHVGRRISIGRRGKGESGQARRNQTGTDRQTTAYRAGWSSFLFVLFFYFFLTCVCSFGGAKMTDLLNQTAQNNARFYIIEKILDHNSKRLYNIKNKIDKPHNHTPKISHYRWLKQMFQDCLGLHLSCCPIFSFIFFNLVLLHAEFLLLALRVN